MLVDRRPTSLREGARLATAWLASPSGRGVLAALLVLAVGQGAVAAYESVVLGLPVVREEPVGFLPYQLAQSLFAMLAAAWLVSALYKARARSSLLECEPAGRFGIAVGLAGLVAGAAATLLFLTSPAAFHFGAQEDRPLEWASALLLLGAAGMVAHHGWRARRSPVTLALAAALALLLLLIGMEEISWGQRLFGFATPDSLAEVNWQAEFNFHNVQTDLSETAYYAGAIFFLILLPWLRDLLPGGLAGHPLLALAPRRGVALVSAPVAWLNCGHWNLFSIQLGTLLAVMAFLTWSRVAFGRSRGAEGAAFLAAAVATVVGQALFLAFGPNMVEIPDATEYKEFFIALGFAFYAASFARGDRVSVAGA